MNTCIEQHHGVPASGGRYAVIPAWLAIAIPICTALLATSPALAQAPAPQPFFVSTSSVPMRRNAQAAIVASRAIDDGVHLLLRHALKGTWTEANWLGRTGRALTLIGFDAPLSFFVVGLNHEYGHIERAREVGIAWRLKVIGSPWSEQAFVLSGPPITDMSTAAGGFDASEALKEIVEERWYTARATTVSDALLLLGTTVHLPLYARRDLRNDILGSIPRLHAASGDLAGYLREWTADPSGGMGRHDDIVRAGRSIRRSVWLNLLDWSTMSAARELASTYIWQGSEVLAARWIPIGTVRLAPGLRYLPSPEGPERAIRTWLTYKAFLGKVWVRWTDPKEGRRLFGVGVSLAQSRTALRPRVSIDVWNGTEGVTRWRAEVAGNATTPGIPRVRLAFAFGYKTRGYVIGFPDRSGAYAEAGAIVSVK